MDDPLRDFLQALLFEGRARLRIPYEPEVGASPESLAILERAHALRALELAGPPIPFDAEVAGAAAVITRRACIALVDRGQTPEELAVGLAMPRIPRTPYDHLSADLTLRFLPTTLRRARGVDAADPLVLALSNLLRAWPLSGVLAGLDDPPTVPLDFAGHRGLMMLYAERLVPRGRPGWYPEGAAGEHVDLARSLPARDAAPHDVRDRKR